MKYRNLILGVSAGILTALSPLPSQNLEAKLMVNNVADDKIQREDTRRQLANAFLEVGVGYYDAAKFREAQIYLSDSFELFKTTKKPEGDLELSKSALYLAHSYLMLALSETHQIKQRRKLQSSIDSYQKSIDEYETYVSNNASLLDAAKPILAERLLFITLCYYWLGEFELGTDKAVEALNLSANKDTLTSFGRMILDLPIPIINEIMARIINSIGPNTTKELIDLIKNSKP